MTQRKLAHERKTLGRPASLTAEQVAAALARYRSGEPLTGIAAEYGVHRNTMYRATRRVKKQRRP